MKIPAEFDAMAVRFYADGFRDAKSEDEWIASRVRGLDAQQKAAVRSFLDELLKREPDGVELRRIWQATSSDVVFPNDEHLRHFLLMIRDKLVV